MNKYSNRVQHEFEDVLLDLSKNALTTYAEAMLRANEYVKNFAKKKQVTEQERLEILDLCEELVEDWFPDTEVNRVWNITNS